MKVDFQKMSDSKTIKLLRELCKKAKGQDSAEFEYLNCQVELFGKTVNLVAVRAKPTGHRQSNVEYIVPWILDDQSPNCMRCNIAFSFMSSWRHHCRICGYLVCKKCSKELRVIASLENDEVGSRVCNYCTESHRSLPITPEDVAAIKDSPAAVEGLSPAQAPLKPVVAVTQASPIVSAMKTVDGTPKTETIVPTSNPPTLQPESIAVIPEVVKLDTAMIQRLSECILAAEQAGESRRTELADLKQQRLAQFLSAINYEQLEEYRILSIAERAELQQMSQEKKRKELEQQQKANLVAFLDTHEEASSSLSIKDRAELVTVQSQRERQQRLEQEKQARLSSFLATPDNTTSNSSNNSHVAQRFEDARLRQQSEEKERIALLKRDPSRSIRVTATASGEGGDKTSPAFVLANVIQEAEETPEAAKTEVEFTVVATATEEEEEAAEEVSEQDIILSSPQPADNTLPSCAVTPVVDLSRLGAVGEELDHRLAQVMSQSLWQATDSPTTDGGDASSSTQSTPGYAPSHVHGHGLNLANGGQRLSAINEPSMEVTGTDLMLDSDTTLIVEDRDGQEGADEEDEDGDRLSNLDFLSTHSHSQPSLMSSRPQSERVAVESVFTTVIDEESDEDNGNDNEDEESKKRRVSSRVTTPPPNKRRSLNLDIAESGEGGEGEKKPGDSFFDSPFVIATPSNALHKNTVAAAGAEVEVGEAETEEAETEAKETEEKNKGDNSNGNGNGKKKNKNKKNKNKK